MSASVVSMKRWGIPEKKKSPEISLLERLVWVKYMSHWWPALIYHSYTELQQHLYDQLDMVLKAQFAMAIMRQCQDKRRIRVARLLGRPILEVIEVEEDCYCEFYWQLPNVLPKACRVSRYGGNEELFLDFHRSLDQVEEIIREVSQENFALVPNGDQQTWLQRAQMVLTEGDDDASTVNFLNPLTSPVHPVQTLRVPSPTKQVPPSTTIQPRLSGSSTIATNDVGAWDSIIKTISNSFDVGSKQDDSISTQEDSTSPAMPLVETPKPSEKKSAWGSSSRSGKSKTSRSTDKVDNRTTSTLKKTGKVNTKADDIKMPGFSDTFDNGASAKPTKNAEESREPPCPERTPFETHAASRATRSRSTIYPPPYATEGAKPKELLPGLEGDDILLGLSAQVEGAQNIWMGVMNTMTTSRGQDGELPNNDVGGQRDPEAKTTPEREDESIRKNIQRALAAEGAPKEEAEIVVESPPKAIVSLWQRFTCMS
jgi:hypothetical protein